MLQLIASLQPEAHSDVSKWCIGEPGAKSPAETQVRESPDQLLAHGQLSTSTCHTHSAPQTDVLTTTQPEKGTQLEKLMLLAVGQIADLKRY